MSNHDILIIGIENWTTGQRPDGIDNDDIRNGDLIAPAGPLHQRLDREPYGDFEIREVRDDRSLTQYDDWTLHFADGTTLDQSDGKQAVADAIQDGKQPVDLNGVLPVKAENVDLANDLIRKGLPTQYQGDYERVQQWADDNDVSLPANRREAMMKAHDEGCEFVRAVESPEV